MTSSPTCRHTTEHRPSNHNSAIQGGPNSYYAYIARHNIHLESFLTMATQSTTYYEQTENMYSLLGTTQAVDIGYYRKITAKANEKGLTFFSENMFYQIQLTPAAVNVINSFLPQIREKVELLSSKKLEEKFILPLGARIFLEIDPKFKCVSIRRFFRPKADPNKLLPGFSGITLKLTEFQLLDQHWNQLIQSFLWQEAECCYFTDPAQHTACTHCWD